MATTGWGDRSKGQSPALAQGSSRPSNVSQPSRATGLLTGRAVARGRNQEQNLRMEMPDRSLYRSPSEWRDDWISQGWRIPIQAGWALSSTMETLGLTFPEAFDFLHRHRKLIVVGNAVIADLSFQELLEEERGRAR